MSEEKKQRKSFRPFRFITSKIRNKMLAILLGTALGTLLVAFAAIVSMEISQNTIDNVIDVKGEIVSLAVTVQEELLKAREQDQKYLLNYKKLGFENAHGEYVVKVEEHAKKADQAIVAMLKLEPGEGITDQLIETQKLIASYKGGFLELVRENENAGFRNYGAVGELRNAVHAIEEMILDSAFDGLRVEMLTLRRHEKDYLLRGDRKYVLSVFQQTETLKSQIVLSALNEDEKKRGSAFADTYLMSFNNVVKAKAKVAEASRQFTAAVNNVLPTLETIEESVILDQDNAIIAMKKQVQIALIVVVVATVVTLLLGVFAAFFFSRRLTLQIDNIMGMFGSIGIGDFSSRADIVTHDELGEMAESLNAMLDNTLSLIQSRDERDAIQGSIMTLLTEISDLASGDLTARAEVTEDITGALADSFNTMAEQLSTVVLDVKEASSQVGKSSHDVDAITRNLSGYSEEQAEKVTEAIVKIEEMAERFKGVSENASKSAAVSNVAKQNAQDGSDAVKRTNEAMASIKENMRGTSRTIKRLGESSQEIGNIVQIINDIADRTSILALNASIQASMAGDAGRGFAVVAEEVQRLAERSAESTKQIESLIQAIQNEISAAGLSMETSIQYVVDGTDLADEAHSKLGEIESVSNQLAEIIESIAASAKQQSEESEQITEMMQVVGELTEKTTSATRETTASMEKITTTSKQLEDSIAIFKVEE